ncbi:hypothetical protein LG314_11270 [Agrococcus terreus]|uniref:hypothetical protein n=1 Tax=Agrococcus terreus TaxID=574649 RepID=UPI00384B6EC8
MTLQRARAGSARRAAARLLLVGLAAAALTSAAPTAWLRERLRAGCELAGGDWRCDTGPFDVGAAIAVVVLVGIALGWAWLVLRATADAPRQRADQLAAIGVIAVLPGLAWSAWLLVDALLSGTAGAALEVDRAAMWVERAMVPTLVLAGAGALALVGLRTRAAGSQPKVAAIQLSASLVLLLGASLTTLFGLLPTSLAAAAAIVAAWRVARAQGRDR